MQNFDQNTSTSNELLLPVGNYQMAVSAIHNGADAIYVGMPGFNARGRSHDHEIEQLKEIIEICHLYGVKVNLAFNILIFENELELAMATLDKVIPFGPDALIIQDLGLAKLVRERYPAQVIHGSTQMTVTNHEAIELLHDLEIKRFVVGRENTLAEIKDIKEKSGKELEVFVHGALCVAYSGQCFTSETLGGRSANRGKCAQSCRFNYDIYVDDKKKNLSGREYLVSPKDLCGINEIPELLKIGVDSFKVEGRLKGPEYVASAARSYRKAIDGHLSSTESKKLEEDMALTYSRGFYSGWLNGVAHQELVDGSYQNHRGLKIGVVVNSFKDTVTIDTEHKLDNGDGLFFVGSDASKNLGEKVYNANYGPKGAQVKLGPKVDVKDIKVGSEVYLNHKTKLFKELNQSYQNRQLLKTLPLTIHIKAALGEVVSVACSDGTHKVELISTSVTEPANKGGASKESLFNSFKGLAHTPYHLEELTYDIDSGLFIHNRTLKDLKQKMVALLNEKRTFIEQPIPKSINIHNSYDKKGVDSAKLSILIRKIEQLHTLENYILNLGPELKNSIKQIICDYEFGKDYVKSVKIIKELGIKATIATTRILKPSEYHNFRLIERANPDGLLIRNLGALNYFKNSDVELFGDFSLNATNSITFDYLTKKGLSTLCASYDLNVNQLEDLVLHTDTSKVEITIHQYMPEFHMEHCVFAAFLSKGNSFRDCGKPCEKHEVHMIDMYGNRHEIKADQECRNTMFSAKAQSVVKFIPNWMSSGVSNFRFECLHEDGDKLITKVDTYLKLMNQQLSVSDVYSIMGEVETYGLSTGAFEKTTEYQSRKK